MGIWDESKHHRDFHGEFSGSGGHGKHRKPLHVKTDRADAIERIASGHLPPAGRRGRASGVEHRARKARLQRAVEVPRGVREPETLQERNSLEWASPRKAREQIAKTGDAKMPRKDAISRTASMVRMDGAKMPTVGTKRTFAGKAVRVRAMTPPPGTRATMRGKYNASKYGG